MRVQSYKDISSTCSAARRSVKGLLGEDQDERYWARAVNTLRDVSVAFGCLTKTLGDQGEATDAARDDIQALTESIIHAAVGEDSHSGKKVRYNPRDRARTWTVTADLSGDSEGMGLVQYKGIKASSAKAACEKVKDLISEDYGGQEVVWLRDENGKKFEAINAQPS
jgi:hypothetical protein